MDFLSPLLARFSLHAHVFYAGALCNNIDFHRHDNFSYVHIVRNGRLRVTHPRAAPLVVEEPTLLFYPRAAPHGFRVVENARDGAKTEGVCASIEFGSALGNPVLRGLPELLTIPLATMRGVASTLDLMFEEGFAARAGRTAAINRLTEYFVVLLLRYVVDANLIRSGTLAALSDKRLTKSVNAMHERPEHNWTLERLAKASGMSRARYAERFRATTGLTPMEYLTDWRIGVAQTLLKQGGQLKLIAPQVGYRNPAALSRVFTQRVGVSPAKWAADAGKHDTVELLRASPYVKPAKRRG